MKKTKTPKRTLRGIFASTQWNRVTRAERNWATEMLALLSSKK